VVVVVVSVVFRVCAKANRIWRRLRNLWNPSDLQRTVDFQQLAFNGFQGMRVAHFLEIPVVLKISKRVFGILATRSEILKVRFDFLKTRFEKLKPLFETLKTRFENLKNAFGGSQNAF